MTKIPTKKELIAAMRASNFKPMTKNGGARWVPELDAKGEPVYKKGHWVDKPRIPTNDGFTANLDGFIACIYSNGRVTLDILSNTCGDLLDVKVDGNDTKEIIKNGAAALRLCIQKSGLE